MSDYTKIKPEGFTDFEKGQLTEKIHILEIRMRNLELSQAKLAKKLNLFHGVGIGLLVVVSSAYTFFSDLFRTIGS